LRNRFTPSQQQPRRSTRLLLRRLAALPALLGALVLVACGATATSGSGGFSPSPTSAPTYTPTSGHILIRLYHTPGFIFPPIVGVPEWTLYGDGTLLTRTLPDQTAAPLSGLLVAHLNADQVAHILDVVVNQYAFFASTREAYGRPVPDVGALRFTVNAAGKSKTITLLPEEGPSPDRQTANVYAAEKYLLGYQAAGAVPYVAPRVALLVYPRGTYPGTQFNPAWPFGDVSLAAAAAHSCALLPVTAMCPTPSGGSPALTVVSGAESEDILRFLAGTPGSASQGGTAYGVLPYPLLPDSTHPDAGAPGLDMITAAGEQRVALVPAQPVQG
jgi:hypothetical protein